MPPGGTWRRSAGLGFGKRGRSRAAPCHPLGLPRTGGTRSMFRGPGDGSNPRRANGSAGPAVVPRRITRKPAGRRGPPTRGPANPPRSLIAGATGPRGRGPRRSGVPASVETTKAPQQSGEGTVPIFCGRTPQKWDSPARAALFSATADRWAIPRKLLSSSGRVYILWGGLGAVIAVALRPQRPYDGSRPRCTILCGPHANSHSHVGGREAAGTWKFLEGEGRCRCPSSLPWW
jgi:hypothetical protein